VLFNHRSPPSTVVDRLFKVSTRVCLNLHSIALVFRACVCERDIEMSGGCRWWKPAEESTMVSALAHVVAGGDDNKPAPAAAMAHVHAPGGSYYYSAASSAPTPDQFAAAAGEQQARIIIPVFFIR
jgi:hypothetical protein